MGINIFETAPTGANVRRQPFANLTNPNDKPKAKVWLNIGYEAGGKFINLPIGLPIDTMDPAEIRGQNVDWVKQRTAQNQLLKALQDLGLKMQPGEERDINLTLRMRRVSEELSVSQEENEYAIDFGSLLAAE